MTPQEFDTSLTDLETRVDRLRALYENWFRGYEKSEPMVARKEVERRVYAMRKELPRNTALRFRYHQLYQRFTTLANYWQRTARQIEEGTYRLQLQRMRRRRPGDDAAATLPPRAALADDDTPPPANSYELNLDETLDVQKLLEESDFDEVASALERRAPVRDSALSPSAPPAGGGRRFSRPAALSDTPKRPSLTLELGGEDVDGLSQILAPSSSIPAGGPRPGRPSMIFDPQRSASKAPSGSAPSDPGELPELPKPPRLPVAPLAGPPMASLAPPAPLAPGTPGRAPPAAGRDGGPSVPRPHVPPPPPPGALSRAPGAMPVSPGARPPVPSLPAKPAASTGEAPTPLSDQRMRRIYDEYAAARRKNNEGEVRFETLAGSIQKMLPELTKKHQGKQIDFEVVVKDGRVGLKPRAT